MFLITEDMLFFHENMEFQRVRSDENSILWFSFRLLLKSRLYCSVDYSPSQSPTKTLYIRLVFVRSGAGEKRFPRLGSLKLYSSCYQLFLLPFFTVKVHSYTVKYMFLTFSTQWNSIGRRNRRWKAALEPGAWISLHFHSSRFQN